MLIRILEVLACILTLLGLWQAGKDRRWWLVYIAGSFPFMFVQYHKELYGLTFFGFITLIIGIKNYIKAGE